MSYLAKDFNSIQNGDGPEDNHQMDPIAVALFSVKRAMADLDHLYRSDHRILVRRRQQYLSNEYVAGLDPTIS